MREIAEEVISAHEFLMRTTQLWEAPIIPVLTDPVTGRGAAVHELDHPLRCSSGPE